MKYATSRVARVLACATLALAAAGANSQVYPRKPIRMVEPFPAGGGVDIAVRIISPMLSEALGQSIVIDYRSGASGTVGTEIVAKAAPDGYTLLVTFSSHATNATLYTKLGFDTVNDFAPITLIATVPNILVANVSLPVKTVKELIALAKEQPGKILYASIGSGSPSHLSAELFNMMAGIRMTHIPYRGAAPSLVALISGETQIFITTILFALPYVQTGKLRAIAIASLKRSPVMPDAPTIDESGLKDYDSTAWYGLLAPAKTPQPIIELLHRETVKLLRLPATRASYLKLGAEPVGNTPEQFGALIKSDIEKWGKVVKATGTTLD